MTTDDLLARVRRGPLPPESDELAEEAIRREIASWKPRRRETFLAEVIDAICDGIEDNPSRARWYVERALRSRYLPSAPLPEWPS
jgi:hypothetical protein